MALLAVVMLGFPPFGCSLVSFDALFMCLLVGVVCWETLVQQHSPSFSDQASGQRYYCRHVDLCYHLYSAFLSLGFMTSASMKVHHSLSF